MTHRVHPSVKDVQPAALDAVTYRAAPEPEREELSVRDDAVLGVGEACDGLIRSMFGPYDGPDVESFAHTLDPDAAIASAVRRYVTSG